MPRAWAVAALLLVGCSSAGGPRHGAAGSTSAIASSTAAPSPTSTSVVAPVAAGWLTYHHDPGRSGVDPTFPPFEQGRFGRVWTSGELDGAVYAEPLVAGGRVIAATEGDSVYALDAATGGVLWRTNLGQPMAGGQLPCGNIDPSGITATPVVDAAGGVVRVVDFVQPGRHELVALDLASGQIRTRRVADPPGADPLVEQERGALAEANGMVYVPFGGLLGDCGAYHGYVVGFPLGGGPPAVWEVPASRGGGIWSPAGPVVGASGSVFVATGNSFSRTGFDEANAVVRLSTGLRAEDVFAPANWAALNTSDTDLGSTSPVLLPGGLVLQVGKEGVGYLLRADQLGGVGGQAFAAPVCSGGAFGGTAVSGTTVYVPCRDGLVAVEVDTNRVQFSVRWRRHGLAAGPPVLAGGVLWAVGLDGTLAGVDPATGAARFSDAVGPVTHFPSLAAYGGRLFVPAADRIIADGTS